MGISRIGTSRRWSDAVIYRDTVYLVEVASNTKSGVKEQALEILNSLENSLLKLGSSKAHLLSVTIYLRDIDTIDEFNEVWDNWVPEGSAPSRACVEAKLANPEYRVEIQVTAAIADRVSSGVKFMT